MLASKAVFEFDKNAPARIGVLPRHAKSSDEMKWFDVKVCTMFHVANAYEVEEDGEQVVVIQACRIETIDMTELSTDANIPYEWRLHMESGLVKEGPIGVTSGDFPQVNPNFHARQHRYVYLATLCEERETASFPGIVKIDAVEKREVAKLVYGEGMYGGEMSFVAREGASSEDDGYLVGFVHKEKENQSEFWVVSALTLECICKVRLSARVPYGFHSLWLDAEKVKGQTVRSML